MWADLPVGCTQEHVDGDPWLSEVWTSWRCGLDHAWTQHRPFDPQGWEHGHAAPYSPEVSRDREQVTATLAVRATPSHEATVHAGPVQPPLLLNPASSSRLPSGPLLTPSSGMACDWSTALVSAPLVATSTLASDNRSQAPPRPPLQTLTTFPTFEHLMPARLG